MLSRKFRLPASIQFKNTKFFSSPFFTVKVIPNSLSCSRFGFIISKKLDKRAVVRNTTKRKVRSCIEESWLSLKGYDMLFVLKKDSIEAKREDVYREIEGIMKKL